MIDLKKMIIDNKKIMKDNKKMMMIVDKCSRCPAKWLLISPRLPAPLLFLSFYLHIFNILSYIFFYLHNFFTSFLSPFARPSGAPVLFLPFYLQTLLFNILSYIYFYLHNLFISPLLLTHASL